MIEKIKKHFKKLNNIQKTLILILVTFLMIGDTILKELGVGHYDREETLIGIIVVSVLGIFLFKNKSEKN